MFGGAVPKGAVRDLTARMERVLRAVDDLRRLLNAGEPEGEVASKQRHVKLLVQELDTGRQAALDAVRANMRKWGEPWAVARRSSGLAVVLRCTASLACGCACKWRRNAWP